MYVVWAIILQWAASYSCIGLLLIIIIIIHLFRNTQYSAKIKTWTLKKTHQAHDKPLWWPLRKKLVIFLQIVYEIGTTYSEVQEEMLESPLGDDTGAKVTGGEFETFVQQQQHFPGSVLIESISQQVSLYSAKTWEFRYFALRSNNVVLTCCRHAGKYRSVRSSLGGRSFTVWG